MLQAFCKENCSERYSELLYLFTDLFPWGLAVNKHRFFLFINLFISAWLSPIEFRLLSVSCSCLLAGCRRRQGTVPGGAVCPVTAGAFVGDLSRG